MKLYYIIHIVVAFIAIYISYKCNGDRFKLFPVISSVFIPYIYLILMLFSNRQCLIKLLT